MNESDLHFHSSYPPKPVLIEGERKSSLTRGLTSLLIFLAVSLLLFGWDLWYVMILIAVLFIHELGHYLAMRYFHYRDVSIFFLPFLGAVTTGDKAEISQKQSAIVYLAGPLPGIFLGVLCYIANHAWGMPLLGKAANIFIFLNLFNLLPIMPLDGGGLVQTLFLKSRGLITKIFLTLSMLALVYFSITAGAWTLLLIPAFMVMQFITITKVERIHSALDERGIAYEKTYEELTDEEYWLIREETANVFTGIVLANRYTVQSREAEIILKVKTVLDKPIKKDLGVLGKFLVVLAWVICFIAPLATILTLVIIK